MLPSESPFTNPVELKELPHHLDGAFGWLKETPTHDEWAIGDVSAAELQPQLHSAIDSGVAFGITLPVTFVYFISDPSLHKHIRSVSASFLDLATTVLPFEGGYLLRFLADQQGCAYWYLYINADGSDHCVVGSWDYFDAIKMDCAPEEIVESDFFFEAESFEAFLSRFWLENEILFAQYDSKPMPDFPARVLDLYTHKDTDW